MREMRSSAYPTSGAGYIPPPLLTSRKGSELTTSKALSSMSMTATQVCGLLMSPCPVPLSGLNVKGASPPLSKLKPARPTVYHTSTVQRVRTDTLAAMSSSTSHSIRSGGTPRRVQARRIIALLTESKAFLMSQEDP